MQGMDLFLCANSRRSVCPACTLWVASQPRCGLRFYCGEKRLDTAKALRLRFHDKLNRFLKLSRIVKDRPRHRCPSIRTQHGGAATKFDFSD